MGRSSARRFLLALSLFSAITLSTEAKGGTDMTLTISTDAFKEGEIIAREHTCEGADVSPALKWQGAPAGTKSFALIVDDPDAPSGTFVHWVAYDLPASLVGLKRGEKAGNRFKEGVNGFGKTGYNGPCPPRGHGRHRYFFKLYALDVETLGLKKPGADKREVEAAIRGHALGEAKTMGTYERK
jgi:hypothetical protein